MSDQSTKDYLFSKEGRGALLWVGAFLAFAGLVVWFVIGTLFPGEPERKPPSEKSQRASGESDVEARNTEGVRPDLTSENLSSEARGALEQFNAQAEAEGRMGRPTPDDVVLIDVPGLSGPTTNETSQAEGLSGECEVVGFTRGGDSVCQGQTGGREIIGYTESGEAIYGQPRATGEIVGYTQDGRPIYGVTDGRMPSNLTREERRELQQRNEDRQQAIIAEHDEYRSRRFTAAVELLNYEGTPASIASVSFDRSVSTNDSDAPDPLRIRRKEDGTAGVVRGESGEGGGTCEAPLVRGGDIRYAQTDIALNTDFEGPVRITFLEGKTRGYVGMGTFELNELGAKMKLTIDTLFDQDGQRYQVNGYVLDPDTTLWAMSSDVDRHLIYRYGGFGLGAVLSSFQVLAENRAQISETVTPDGTRSTQNRDPDGKQVTWTVLGEFGELFEELFRDSINRPITVTLDPGEEVGVLFQDTVCELNTDISKQRRAEAEREARGFGDPVL